jgi:hypothetical protein
MAELRGPVVGYGPAPVDPWDAVKGLEILDAARRSAEMATVVSAIANR